METIKKRYNDKVYEFREPMLSDNTLSIATAHELLVACKKYYTSEDIALYKNFSLMMLTLVSIDGVRCEGPQAREEFLRMTLRDQLNLMRGVLGERFSASPVEDVS